MQKWLGSDVERAGSGVEWVGSGVERVGSGGGGGGLYFLNFLI